MGRSRRQRLIDFLTFPLRALTVIDRDRWGLSSIAAERFDGVAREVRGYCLDIGCGRRNFFIARVLGGNGKGFDVFPYEGLTRENLLADLARFPVDDASFDTVTFIANINHVPRSKRDVELAEAFRCLKPGGNIVVTMGNPLAEVVAHGMVHWYDRLLGTHYDVDSERGMTPEEAFYLKDPEIIERLTRAGFRRIAKKYFLTQWGLNHLFVAWKEFSA